MVRYTIPQESLIHGISQQPAKTRGHLFCEDQVNCVSSPILGLTKRPASVMSTKLTDSLSLPARATHAIDRSFEDQFFLTFAHQEVRAFNVSGTEYYVADLVSYENEFDRFAYLDLRAKYRDGSGPWIEINQITATTAEGLGGLPAGLSNGDSSIEGPLGFSQWRLLQATAPPTTGLQDIFPKSGTVWPDGTASVSLYVKLPAALASPSFELSLYADPGDPTSFAGATFTWTGGAPVETATDTGVTTTVTGPLVDGSYRVYLEVDTADVAGSVPGDNLFVQLGVNSTVGFTDLLAWGLMLSAGGPAASSDYLDTPETIKATTVTDTTLVTNQRTQVAQSTFVLDVSPSISTVLGNHEFVSGVSAAAQDVLYVQVVQGVYDALYEISVGTENSDPITVTVETSSSATVDKNVDVYEVDILTSGSAGLWQITVDTQLVSYTSSASGLNRYKVAKGLAKAINLSTARVTAVVKNEYKIVITGEPKGVPINVSDPLTAMPGGGATSYVIQTHFATNDALADIGAEDIAAEFVKKFAALGTSWSDNLLCERIASTLVFFAKEEITYFDTKDSNGDQLLRPAHKSVQEFSDLPLRAVPGTRIKISQAENEQDTIGYFVEFKTNLDDTSQGADGKWEESLDYAVPTSLDQQTFPHTLIPRLYDAGGNQYNGDTFPDGHTGEPGTLYFEWSTIPWEDRLVGDEILSPLPAFMDPEINPSLAIRQIAYVRGRLAILGDTVVVFSEANRFYSFFRTTTRVLLDADTFYVVASHPDMTYVDRILPFSDRLVLFSEKAQMILTGNPFAGRTVSLEPFLRYDIESSVSPVSHGERLYSLFPRDFGKYLGLREVFPKDRIFTDEDRSLQIPRYMEAEPISFGRSSDGETFAIVSALEPNAITLYKTLRQDDAVLQQAWSKLTFSDDDVILGAHFLNSKLVYLISRTGGHYIEVMDFAPYIIDDGLDFQVRLDRRVVSDTLSSVTGGGQTTLTLPWDIPSGFTCVVVGSDGVLAETVSTFTGVSGSHSITVTGDHTSGSYVGLLFESSYTFTQVQPKESSDRGEATTITGSSVTILNMRVAYEDTAYLKVLTESPGRSDVEVEFSSDSLEDGTIYSSILLPTEQATVSLVSTSFKPFRALNVEWDADLTKRGTRLRL
jgi:hypothetical protein